MIPKFRAWIKSLEVTADVLAIRFEDKEVLLKGYKRNSVADFDQVEFMQYTGLKDKNGVEIYEGDIITEEIGEGEYLFAEVIYKDGCFLGKEQNFKPEYPISDFVKGKVIGNIYEHPELLEEEE